VKSILTYHEFIIK